MTRVPFAIGVLLLAALVAAVPGTAATAPGVHAVVLDRVEEVPVQDFSFAPCPDTGSFVPLETGFRFEERQAGTAAAGGTPYPGGYLAVGCGEAVVTRTPPVGARMLEVAFQGDRVVDEFDVQGTDLTPPSVAFEQELHLRSADGASDREVAYFDATEGGAPMRPIAPEAFLLPREGGPFDLAWVFRDSSYFVGPEMPDVLSGQAFAATVQHVELRYVGIPLQHRVAERLEREGTLLVGETRVRVDVAEAASADLRVVVAGGLAFEAVAGPDGSHVHATTTRTAAGPDGFDRGAVLLETLDDGSLQVTVPRELLATMGAGEYTLSFTSLDAVRTFPWLLPLVLLVLLAPLPFALVAYRHVHRFEDEAFGGFRRSAHNLRVALVVAFAYYAIVLVSHFLGSRLELMTAWPMPMEAALLYVQVAVAVAAFLALYAVAQELYRITVPKALPDAAARPGHLPEDDA